MQQFTKAVPAIQIHVSGAGMIRLQFAGQCVGFAVSCRSAGHQADQLDRLLFAIREHGHNSPCDATTNVSFSSALSEKSVVGVVGVAKATWIVEADDGTPIRSFPTQDVADGFRRVLEEYHRLLPPAADDGQWSPAQIAWFRNHPAPIASACGGRLRTRKVGVH